MAGLKLKYEVIQECIGKIQNLPTEYPAETRPAVSGEGKGITEMEKLVDLYISFYESMEDLIEETVKYLNRMVKDFQAMDVKKPGTDVCRG